MSVDWTKPIEAYHEDGRVVAGAVEGDQDRDGDRLFLPKLDGKILHFKPDGDQYDGHEHYGWRIRNVAAPVRTYEDGIRDALAIVAKHAKDDKPAPDRYGEVFDDCAAFICGDIEVELKSLLPKDVAEERASALVEEWIDAELDDNPGAVPSTVERFSLWLARTGKIKEG